jgi:hypothetical protein
VRSALGEGVSGTLTVRPSPLSSACTQAQAATATTAATVTLMADEPLHRSESKMLLTVATKVVNILPAKSERSSS